MNILGLSISVNRGTERQSQWGRRTAAMGATALTVMGVGIAYASWSTNGSGIATASAGSALPVNATVQAVTSSSTLLYPGVSAPLIVNVHNPNSFSVKISAITLTNNQQPSSVGGSLKNSTTCTAAASAVTLVGASSLTSLTTPIAAGGDATVNLPGGVAMGLGSDDGCQGGSFTFTTGVLVTAAAG
jgi:hypothetical protein